jgi:RAB protein geranylgeranyltransferase component A
MLEIDLIPKKLLASKGYVGMTLLHGIVIHVSRCMFRNYHVNDSNPRKKLTGNSKLGNNV